MLYNLNGKFAAVCAFTQRQGGAFIAMFYYIQQAGKAFIGIFRGFYA
jgi:hypothetical protein